MKYPSYYDYTNSILAMLDISHSIPRMIGFVFFLKFLLMKVCKVYFYPLTSTWTPYYRTGLKFPF